MYPVQYRQYSTVTVTQGFRGRSAAERPPPTTSAMRPFANHSSTVPRRSLASLDFSCPSLEIRALRKCAPTTLLTVAAASAAVEPGVVRQPMLCAAQSCSARVYAAVEAGRRSRGHHNGGFKLQACNSAWIWKQTLDLEKKIGSRCSKLGKSITVTTSLTGTNSRSAATTSSFTTSDFIQAKIHSTS